MPESWDADTEENKARRKAARVPDDVKHKEKWRLVLEMTQEALDSGLKPQPVLGDQAYGKVHAFRAELDAQGLQYMLEVPSDLVAHPVSVRPRKLTGKRADASKPLIREQARSLASLAEGHVFRFVPGLPGKYLALRIRPAGKDIKPGPDGQYEACWLVLWLMLDGTIKYLLSNLPANARLRKLARLASLRWRIEQDYREDKQCLGLAHLQTRTYGAWYKHAALLAVARLLVLSQMLTAAEGSFYKALTSLRKLIIGLIGHCTTCGWTAHPPSESAPA